MLVFVIIEVVVEIVRCEIKVLMCFKGRCNRICLWFGCGVRELMLILEFLV